MDEGYPKRDRASKTNNGQPLNHTAMTTKNLLAICIFTLLTVDLTYARWPQVDPMAENYYPQSPYAFCGNNPVNNIDKDGRDWYSFQEKYTDDDGTEQTRTQYVYRDAPLSNKEMKALGYTHLGYTYTDNDGNYYSLLGEIKDISTDEGKLYSLVDNAIINNYTQSAQGSWSSEPAYEPATDFSGIKSYQENIFGSGNNVYSYKNSYAGTTMYFQVNKQNMKGVYVPPSSKFGAPNYMPGSPKLPVAYYAYIRQKNTSSGNIVYLPFANSRALEIYNTKLNKLFSGR